MTVSDDERRIVKALIILCLMLLTASCTAQSAVNPRYTIGIVNPVSMRDPVVVSFQRALADLGYTEASITYMYDGPIADVADRNAWAAELVEARVDLIVGIATPGAISAKAATDDIPVVFFPVTDPVGSGLVESLNMPGGNVTGITNGNPHPLRLQLLHEIQPDIDVIYGPYDPDSPPAVATLPSVRETAARLGIEVIAPAVRTDAEILQSIRDIPAEADAIFAMPDPRVAEHWQAWSAAATERNIPFSSLSRTEVKGGVLMSYGEDLEEVARQGARMVDRIFRGTPPSDTPVETADFFLALNLATARQINLEIPDALLQRTTYIYYEEDAS